MTHSKRYIRQTTLPEIGEGGQQRLAEAKVLVIGAGGLGCPVLQNLAAAGVGFIGIADGDVVEESNLHRQYLYTAADCGQPKAEAAAAAIMKLNPEVQVIFHAVFFTKANAAELLSDFEIIVDCTDNLPTRYLINDVAVAKGIPMVYGSIHKFEGQLSVLNYEGGPSYRCLFPDDANLHHLPDCIQGGVLGVLPNTIGVLQATEVLKIILGIGEPHSGKLLVYDGLNQQMQTMTFTRNEDQITTGKRNGLSILKAEAVGPVAISSVVFFEILEQENHLIIDIREDHQEVGIKNQAIEQVPLAALENYLEATARDRRIILLCQHGKTSALAAEYLIQKGFTHISHLLGGSEALVKTTQS